MKSVAAKKSAVFRLANTRHRENLKEIMKMALFTVLEEGRINLASKLRPRRQRVWNCGVEFKSPFIRMKSLQQSFGPRKGPTFGKGLLCRGTPKGGELPWEPRARRKACRPHASSGILANPRRVTRAHAQKHLPPFRLVAAYASGSKVLARPSAPFWSRPSAASAAQRIPKTSCNVPARTAISLVDGRHPVVAAENETKIST